MEENQKNRKKARKWTLLFWTGMIFCFLFYPVFLLDVGLESYLKTKNEIEESKAYRELEVNLEKLLQYGDSTHYYHALLKKIFDIAEEQKDPISYLKKAIPHLKIRNPNTFNFIVWNNTDNKIVDSITDEKGFKYVLKTLYDIFNAVYAENIINYPVEPEKIPIVNEKFEIIRSYIGNFLVSKNLQTPLLKANLGKVISVSATDEKGYFWFQPGKKICMMVTISSSAIKSLSYVERLVNGLNKNSSDKIKFGMIDLLHGNSIIPESDEKKIAELNLGLVKYENYSSQKLYTNNYLMLVKIFNPYVRAFCYTPKRTVHNDQDFRYKIITIAGATIFVFFLVFWQLYRFTNRNFSVRWKLALFFLYANGLPLMALGFIGYDYLQQNKNILLEETYENISHLLNDFDSKFGLIKQEYASDLNSTVKAINRDFSNKTILNKYYAQLKEKAENTHCHDFSIVDKKGNLILSGGSKLNGSAMKDIIFNILKFANNSIYTPLKSFVNEKNSDRKSISSIYKDGIFFHTIISNIANINFEQVMDNASYYYFNFIGDTENRKLDSMVLISWSVQQLQENYVKSYLQQLNKNDKGIKFTAFSETYGKIYPENETIEKDLIAKFRQVLNLSSLSFEEIRIENKNYAAYGAIGKELAQIAIIGYFPMEIINSKVNHIWWNLIIFIITSLVLTSGIIWVLSSNFLEPIKELKGGISAMQHQDFRYRLPIKSADEFGSLNIVFNSALQNLEDLDVAATVQKNLFPLEPLKQNRVFVWGKSVAMTRLGGDYFDFFPLEENEIGVLMGDVAGHGVPAGFLMAMAKASVLLSGKDRKSPAKLLTAIHKVFHTVTTKKIKRMMTCIYFCINTETGAYRVVNAGHCYPAIISKNAKVSYLEMVGTPLGISKKARYTDNEGFLEPNSFMLLYTDGMVEAHNSAGEPLGLNRFTQLVSESYSENPEIFYENLFSGYKKWTPLTDDDMTIVLVKFGFDGKAELAAPEKSIKTSEQLK